MLAFYVFISLQLPQNNTNFYTRPTNFLPKELFPSSLSSASVQRKESTSSNKSARRPIKFPLRKHHSFHFQSSQTVAGMVKQKRHHQSGSRHHTRNKDDHIPSPGASSINIHNIVEQGGNLGPLIFKPYDENSAFKPIQPISQHLNKSMPNNSILDSESSNSISESISNNYRSIIGTGVNNYNNNNNNKNNSSSDAKSSSNTSSSGGSSSDRNRLPRICGTSLKRNIDPNLLSSLDSHIIKSDTNSISNSSSSSSASKRLVYADLLDTSKTNDIKTNNKVNCIPKPSRTQYATIQFPEVNI